MAKLSVNINKIATLRNSRGGNSPDLAHLTKKILEYGAEGITVHPRADRRHITPEDCQIVTEVVSDVERNFEGDLREEFLDLVVLHKPHQCTLVPVKPGEITSNHGWNVEKHGFLLEPVIRHLKDLGIRTSLFVESGDPENVKRVAGIGADRIEIYTEPYAIQFAKGQADSELERIGQCIEAAKTTGMGINAGHDLTLENLPKLVRTFPEIDEVSIGHHLMAYALEFGLKAAIEGYLQAAHSH